MNFARLLKAVAQAARLFLVCDANGSEQFAGEVSQTRFAGEIRGPD
jgi:hypothetical protein